MFFRVVAIITITASIIYVLSKLKKLKISPKEFWHLSMQEFRNNLFRVWLENDVSLFQKTKSTVGYICSLLFFILFLTSFIPVVFGYKMSGIFMMMHVQAALMMSVAVVLLVFLHSNSNQLSLEELSKLYEDVKSKRSLEPQIMLKALYWIIIALILPAMLSIILMLFPLFGTEGLELLADVHRWSVLLLTISLIFVQYFSIVKKGILD